jgi:membrane protease YdiL (CAAX protease family)
MNMEKSSGALAPRQPHRRLLPSFLFDTGHSKPAYVVKAWLLTLLPSLALAGLLQLVAPDAPQPDFGGTGIAIFLLLVLFAPVLETFLMMPPLLLLNRFFGEGPAIIGSGLLWGLAHSWAVAIWGLVVWWPFLVFSAIILAWRKRSLATGMVLVICIHALQNAVAGFSLLFG